MFMALGVLLTPWPLCTLPALAGVMPANAASGATTQAYTEAPIPSATHSAASESAYRSGEGVDVNHAWVRWLPGALPAAGYMTVTNRRSGPITLIGASSPDYGEVMLHQTVHTHDHDTMTAVTALTIPAGATVRMAPGAADGYHWMLMRPSHPIAVGQQVSLRLRLADGQTIVVLMTVGPPTRLQ